MRIVCISSSNIKHARENSTSVKACELIKNMIDKRIHSEIDVETILLVDYELKPCTGCGGCFKVNKCVYDDNFNKIYSLLSVADGLFIVSPHYAPIPAKLNILLEKVEQLAFLKRFNNEQYRSPLFGKPLGIVGHGGGTEEIIKHYKIPVLDTITNALSYPVEMKVIGIDNGYPNGIVFPVKSVKKDKDCIFPIQEYDWQDIEYRLTPLVENFIEVLIKQKNYRKVVREM
jgi:multimeric flavodoxin WrbA